MIVPMERIRIAGPQSLVNRSIKGLTAFGAIHITNSRDDRVLIENGLEVGMLSSEAAEKLRSVESLLFEVKTSLTQIYEARPSHDEISIPGISGRDWTSENVMDETWAIVRKIRAEAEKRQPLTEELAEISSYRRIFEEFQPLVETVAALKGIEISGVFFTEQSQESREKIKQIEKLLNDVTDGACSVIRAKAEAQCPACILVYPASLRDAVQKEVFGHEIRPLYMPQKYERDTFASTMLQLFKREKEAEAELKNCIANLESYASGYTSLLLAAEEGLEETAKRLRIHNYLATSKNTFWISGWIPEKNVAALSAFMEKEFKGDLILYAAKPKPEEYPEVPVLLENPPLVKPFEKLLSLFPPPIYGSMDPTIFLMVSFPIFFGLMLGDIGYAAILCLIGYGLKQRKNNIPVLEDIGSIIYACAISSAVFGTVFGEFFGKLWYGMGFPPPLFDRKEHIIYLLAAVLFLGGLHVLLGNLLALKISIKGGHRMHALKNLSDLVLISSGIAAVGMLVKGYDARLLSIPLLFSLTMKVYAGGMPELLETFKIVSNLLSYARLMALGIASVVLADMADDLYVATGGMFLGIIGAFGVHMVNFVLGIFSPTIQALRLHYVEFFNQFYEAGAVKYMPFRQRL